MEAEYSGNSAPECADADATKSADLIAGWKAYLSTKRIEPLRFTSMSVRILDALVAHDDFRGGRDFGQGVPGNIADEMFVIFMMNACLQNVEPEDMRTVFQELFRHRLADSAARSADKYVHPFLSLERRYSLPTPSASQARQIR